MDQAMQNHLAAATGGRRQMDFVSPKPKQPAPVQQNTPAEQSDTQTKSENNEGQNRPKAVTSAKDAINAMYAAKKAQTEPVRRPVMTAREAVNAAASQNASRATKSAASMHHGQIQKNLNSTRTSASALLRVAESPRLASDRLRAKSSFDPLARQAMPEPKLDTDTDEKQEIPVVRTSLKLGAAAARPKQAAVVLPPNARMARIARPVKSEPLASAHRTKSADLFSRPQPIDAQIIQPNTINPGQTRRVIGDGIKPVAKSSNLKVGFTPKPKAESGPQAIRNAAAEVIRSRPRAARFRTAPKNYATSQPQPIAMDNSYVMTAPPKINLSHNKSRVEQDMAELGMETPQKKQSAGDRAPIGQAQSQTVAAGHGRANVETPSIKETNTSSYSFSRKEKPVDNNRYALGGESPFLKTVNVEKRPLSDTPVTPRPTIERRKIEDKPEKPTKSGRKNVYTKKTDKAKNSKTTAPRPTVIIPTSHRSKMPLFFLILFTIILGALVGAAAYLCFFQ